MKIERKGDWVGALNMPVSMGHEGRDDAVTRVLPVLLEAVQSMRNLI